MQLFSPLRHNRRARTPIPRFLFKLGRPGLPRLKNLCPPNPAGERTVQFALGGGKSMHQPMVAVAVSLLVMPTHTPTEALAFLLRWVHFLAGITWVGLLYFFNLVNVPFMKQVDAGMKAKIFQYMTMPALQLFRWSALLTVF